MEKSLFAQIADRMVIRIWEILKVIKERNATQPFTLLIQKYMFLTFRKRKQLQQPTRLEIETKYFDELLI